MTSDEFEERLMQLIDEARKSLSPEDVISALELRRYALLEEEQAD